MDAKRLFGTDGIRGLANRDLTAELALTYLLLLRIFSLSKLVIPQAIVQKQSWAVIRGPLVNS